MLNRIKALPLKFKVWMAVTSAVIFLVIPTLLFAFLSRDIDSSTKKSALIEFEYCGATPTELCVLSFGRDSIGDTIINFFVPDRAFPDFYLMIKKAGTENSYECKRNGEIKTSVFCSGEALSLKQTVEINLFANESSQQLATGTFFIEAFLVTTQNTTGTPVASLQVTGSPSPSPTATSTPRGVVTATRTPRVDPTRTSYPNPYP
jgi:hypothetical protein